MDGQSLFLTFIVESIIPIKEIGHYRFTSVLQSVVSVSRRVVVQNLSKENEFDSHENKLVGGTRFYVVLHED